MTAYALADGREIAPLPKIGLHEHLDGGLRPGTVIELADAAGAELPARTPEVLGEWFRRQCSGGDLVQYLSTFELTLACMQTAEALERVAREYVEDLAADGVIYAEIRWAPEQHLERGLTLDEAVAAVQRGCEAGEAAVAALGGTIRVGQILIAMRHLDRAAEIAELTLAHRDRGVVGFDIAGPEFGFPAARAREAFDLLATAFMPVTVHAGEADGLASIRGALLDGRALRLGHGVRIVDDLALRGGSNATDRLGGSGLGETALRGVVPGEIRLGRLAQWVLDRGIALEIAPSSNLQTGARGRTIDAHPFDLLYRLGFRVTVNPDNRLMSRTSITRELALLVDAFDYTIEDLAVFQLNAARAAFLPLPEQEALAETITRAYV